MSQDLTHSEITAINSIKTVILEEPMYECPVCGEEFNTSREYENHKRDDNGNFYNDCCPHSQLNK